ncbi:MAG: DUF4199 domain-containing protein [Bacteroidia bacterium]|nr:DUF4199 domain-containing protein [Bacteroidia bacterium]
MNRPLKFGLIAGGINSALSLFIYFSDLKPSTFFMVLQFIPLTVTILCIFLAVNKERNSGNAFDFKSAIRAGVITSLAGAVVYGCTTFFLWSMRDPETLKNDMYDYIEVRKNEVKVPADSAGKAKRLERVLTAGDSAFDKQIYSLAIQNYIEAFAIDPGNERAMKKVEDMVSIQKTEYAKVGNTISGIVQNIVFQVVIGAVIAAISFFLLKQR